MEAPSDESVKNESNEGELIPQSPGLLELPRNGVDAYALGIGDYPGLSLVSVPLTTTNYLSWNDDILNNLTAKGKEGFITGLLPKPNPVDAEYKQWVKNDAMIKALIKNSITPELQRALFLPIHLKLYGIMLGTNTVSGMGFYCLN